MPGSGRARWWPGTGWKRRSARAAWRWSSAPATSGSAAILATGDSNGHAYLWNVATGQKTSTLIGAPSTSVASVAYGFGGKVLAIGDHNGTAYLKRIS